MSPASAGNLEVEKYIGACLISSQNRTKSPNHNSNNSNSGNNSRSDLLYHYGRDIYTGNYTNFDGRFRVQRWAGGMPLISFKHHQRCGKRLEQHDQRNHQQSNPLSRLAVHTQGAPLIVTRTFNNSNNRRKNVPFNNNNNNNSNNKLSDNCNNTNISGNVNNNNNNNKVKNCSESGVAVDAISVTSDESSGSTNSDNCLPRIIKPRKRRKKDRKPPLPHLNQPLQDGFSTDSTSPEIDNNLTNLSPINQFIPFTFNSNNNIQVRSTIQQSFNVVPDKLPLINNYNYNNYKNNDLLYDVTTETPQLHHKFEDVEDINDNINNDIVDINGNQSTLICQCRYCDPSGQIWDIDRNYYSPFLTTPLTNLKTSQQQDNYPIVKSINVEDNSYLLLHRLSSISLNNTDDNNNDRGDDVKVKTRRRGDLEVSTEIVTSLNGHRDLEIKFFSTTTENNCNNSVKRDENIDKFCDNNEIKQIETITN